MSDKTKSVTINIPEGIVQFLEDFKIASGFNSIGEYLENAVVAQVQADIDGEAFNPTVKGVAKKYGLATAFGVTI